MRRKFSLEFKEEAVALVVKQGLTVKQAAADLGIGKSTLDNWLSRYREVERDPNVLGETELAELKRLRKEIRILRIERDLLKKTAVWFARENERGIDS